MLSHGLRTLWGHSQHQQGPGWSGGVRQIPKSHLMWRGSSAPVVILSLRFQVCSEAEVAESNLVTLQVSTGFAFAWEEVSWDDGAGILWEILGVLSLMSSKGTLRKFQVLSMWGCREETGRPGTVPRKCTM